MLVIGNEWNEVIKLCGCGFTAIINIVGARVLTAHYFSTYKGKSTFAGWLGINVGYR